MWCNRLNRLRRDAVPDVSSRAPVWGASLRGAALDCAAEVSSRAPVWGASSVVVADEWADPVSSRAPVWGASASIGSTLTNVLCFKSCPRVGGIICMIGRWRGGASSFKSCPRVGGIGKRIGGCIGYGSFKSCPRVGGILDSCSGRSRMTAVSSRAPVWGASVATITGGHRLTMFQVVPPCGGHLCQRRCHGYL